ncbi:hypothetical protein [Aquimarina latercula]|uniref:hypothetical protein n=1 Tax=Aquimarina latercula TaxID=987 RepID=UPI00040866DB|nr:hypothetical protein [Aquimarina latercula]
MSFFKRSNTEQIEFLEKERLKLWERIEDLEKLTKQLNKRTPEIVKEVTQNSRKVSEFRNKTEAKLNETNTLVEQLSNELESARKIKNEINDFNNEANQQKLAVYKTKIRLDEAESEFEEKLETINSRIGNIDIILEKYPDLESQLSEIDDFILKIENNVEKSSVSLNALNKRKKDIDDLHREVFGYTQTDEETGEENKIEGLKDELDSSYEVLKEKIDESFENVEGLNTNYQGKYESFEKKYKSEYDSFQEEYKKKYQKINDDISKLLPSAMTAGLSSAFSGKKEDEVKSFKKMQRNFNIGIFLMVLVSVIPVFVSLKFLSAGLSFEDVIYKLPRVVLSIIPMYIPILWFTISASKKMNLSKRLIEEYSHKEVLSRTYEGLSTQIENLEDSEQSEELRFRLLTNFLQASSENPGKLISNYETSDHPVMEALEQSYKFQMTVDKLQGIPGMGKMAAIIERKAKKKIAEKKGVIDNALSDVEDELELDVENDE